MTISNPETPRGNEVRGRDRPPAENHLTARPWSKPAEALAPILYDKVDYRLMDTFPASDAVARY